MVLKIYSSIDSLIWMLWLMSAIQSSQQKYGVLSALSAFFIWGLFPFYFKELSDYLAFEVIAHRIIWTCVCCVFLLLLLKKKQWITEIIQKPSLLGYIFVTSVLITANWTIYVWAVNHNQIVEASLGYFMTPLIGVMLAVLVFKEKLRKLQVIAIIFATISVVLQLIMLGKLPWVSLGLACTFSTYGMLHKRMPILPLPSLFLESLLICPVVIGWLFFHDVASSHLSFWTSSHIWFLMLAGPVTLVPLLLYNIATKKVPFALLSFFNYSTPSMIFLLAVFYYKEPFSLTKLILFSLIWIGLALFSIDLWQNRTKKKEQK